MRAVGAAWAAGIRYFDAAPLYGHGLAESRLGAGLRWHGDGSAVISTKVGWLPRPAFGRPTGSALFAGISAFRRDMNYSYDAVMRSFEDSMQRLGTDQIDILLIHDVDRRNQGSRYQEVFRTAMGGAYKALRFLREQRLVRAIGCGLNEWEACEDFARAGDFDCFLLAGGYTLLHQTSLTSFLPLCSTRGIGIIAGAPFNSGILATGAVTDARLNYVRATPERMRRVADIEAVCQRHAVPLRAAALQFALHHPAVTSVVPGAQSVAEVEDNVRMLAHPIPADFWGELKHERLLDSLAPAA